MLKLSIQRHNNRLIHKPKMIQPFFQTKLSLSPIKPALQSHSEAATASKLPQAKPAPQPNPPTHAASKIPHAKPLQTKPPTASKAPQAPNPPTASKIPKAKPVALQMKQHITDNDKKRLLSDAWLTDTDTQISCWHCNFQHNTDCRIHLF